MTSALLVMDVQNGVVDRFQGDPALLDRLAVAVQGARTAEVPVIFVRVAFRDGFPEVSRRNRVFAGVMERGGAMTDSDRGTQIHDAVAPQPGDIVVVKKRISAFAGSDLSEVLRGLGVDTLVLCGIATSGVVLSTVRQAADLDYGLVVLADACADSDPEVHRVLLEKVFPRQADVVTVDAWAAGLAS
jgi:nicotinamidase-related amidase